MVLRESDSSEISREPALHVLAPWSLKATSRFCFVISQLPVQLGRADGDVVREIEQNCRMPGARGV
jgi:hypothetical protein